MTIPQDAGALPPRDPGILVAGPESVRLPDGTELLDRDDKCVELQSSCHAVDTGEVEVLADHWLLYRDIDHRFRVRKIEPHQTEFRGHFAKLGVGDRARLDSLSIHWHGIARVAKTDEPVIEISISSASFVQSITETLSKSHPSRSIQLPNSHDVLGLELDSVNGEATEIVLHETRGDSMARVGFGDALRDGAYLFPDGLRITYRHTTECEYDSTTGCVTRHEVTATKGDTEKKLELSPKKPTASAHGHTFRIEGERLVVR